MSVLSVQAVARRFGDRLLFSGVSFRLAHGDRAGLVGPNGCGKTTLLRIAAGLDGPDEGAVAIARGTRIGFLEQELLTEVPGTVEEHARGAAGHLRELEERLRALEPLLATGDTAALEAYADLQHHFDHAGGYDFDGTVRRVLGGLGLDALRERAVMTLSGGERTRLGLARLLLDDPDILLLDEPTNHLDLAALEWLERFLVERDLTVLVSSHDRWFLDRVTARTLSFEAAAGGAPGREATVVEYRGGYTAYARQRAEREAAQTKAAGRQAREIARTEEYIDRFRAGQLSKQSRGRAKKLARLERIAAPERAAEHGWSLEAAHLASETVVETTALAAGHGERVVVRTPPLRIGRGDRIAVVGPNGAGKTTLARTLAGELPALEGYVRSAPTARLAVLAQQGQGLVGSAGVIDTVGGVSVIEALRTATGLGEQEARDHLARFLFRGEEVYRDVGVLSGGERSRLALARLALAHANLLLLDEPTNHLDLAAREALERVLLDYDGTLLFISHDRYFIDRLGTEIWWVEDGGLKRFKGTWSALQRELSAGREPWEPAVRADAVRGGSAAAAGEPPTLPRVGASGLGRPPGARADRRGPPSLGSRLPSTSSARPQDASGGEAAGDAHGAGGGVEGSRPIREGGLTASPTRTWKPTERTAATRGNAAARGSTRGPGRGDTRTPQERKAARETAAKIKALEAKIAELEAQLRRLAGQLLDISRSGNFMETRRVGEEHAALEASLRTLYEEWAAQERSE